MSEDFRFGWRTRHVIRVLADLSRHPEARPEPLAKGLLRQVNQVLCGEVLGARARDILVDKFVSWLNKYHTYEEKGGKRTGKNPLDSDIIFELVLEPWCFLKVSSVNG
jgi:hypothetical protein